MKLHAAWCATLALAASFLLAAALPAAAAESPPERPAVTVEMMDSNGGWLGTVELRQLAHGTLFVVELENLPPGGHGFHVHQRGVCAPPDFETAEGHFSPRGNDHGFDNEQGPHAGDLPNIHATDNGAVMAEFIAPGLALDAGQAGGDGQNTAGQGGGQSEAAAQAGPFNLRDEDGAAIVIHENADDYRAEPPDSTGARIACGVIKEPEGPAGG